MKSHTKVVGIVQQHRDHIKKTFDSNKIEISYQRSKQLSKAAHCGTLWHTVAHRRRYTVTEFVILRSIHVSTNRQIFLNHLLRNSLSTLASRCSAVTTARWFIIQKWDWENVTTRLRLQLSTCQSRKGKTKILVWKRIGQKCQQGKICR